jgi:hypothetical protein
MRFSCSAFLLVVFSGVVMPAPLHPGSRAFDVPSFCSAVDSQVEASADMASWHPSILYYYQAMLVKAAGVQPNESDEAAFAKIRAFMDSAENLTCRTPNFVPANGNIYKLAVARQSSGFLDDALAHWHVDLNRVDAIDHKTVLDYIADRRKAAGSSAFGLTLDRYYKRFRAAGALHAAELPSASHH